MNILAIESSCDETAAAVVKDGREMLSNVVASQVEEHKLYGGVVPEIASRRHVEAISNVTKKALHDAGLSLENIDAVAVTHSPGLIGCLLVGVNFAKGLSFASNIPLVPVHHLRSHVAANYLVYPNLTPPFIALIVSGGHSHIVKVEDYTTFKVIGQTRDDAVGEAYDKVARSIGLPYPGGVHLDKFAQKGNKAAFKLPHPKIDANPYDFSFSGLKTAVLNLLHNAKQKGEEINNEDLAASFQDTATDILISHTKKVFEDLKKENFYTDKFVLAGGVAANSALRKKAEDFAKKNDLNLYVPPLYLCGDNAAMVGAQAFYEYESGNIADLSLNAAASMNIEL